MKLDLRENMYIRNCYGRIAKIEYIEDNIAYCDNWLYQSYEDHITFINLNDEEDINEILKASYNIIDILECGDIIKLFMEDDIDGEDTNIFELIAINYNDNEIGVFNSDFQIEFLPIENLRGILTHEQMEQMAYKVGD